MNPPEPGEQLLVTLPGTGVTLHLQSLTGVILERAAKPDLTTALQVRCVWGMKNQDQEGDEDGFQPGIRRG